MLPTALFTAALLCDASDWENSAAPLLQRRSVTVSRLGQRLSVDLPRLSTTQSYRLEISVNNALATTLSLDNVKPDCGCTVAYTDRKVIASRDTSVFRFKLSQPKRPGLSVRTIRILNTAQEEQFSLVLNSTYESPIRITPEVVKLRNVDVNRALPFNFSVACSDLADATPNLDSVQWSSSAGVVSDLRFSKTTNSTGTLSGVVRFPESIRTNTALEYITVKYMKRGGGQATDQLPLAVSVVGRLSIVPGELVFASNSFGWQADALLVGDRTLRMSIAEKGLVVTVRDRDGGQHSSNIACHVLATRENLSVLRLDLVGLKDLADSPSGTLAFRQNDGDEFATVRFSTSLPLLEPGAK